MFRLCLLLLILLVMNCSTIEGYESNVPIQLSFDNLDHFILYQNLSNFPVFWLNEDQTELNYCNSGETCSAFTLNPIETGETLGELTFNIDPSLIIKKEDSGSLSNSILELIKDDPETTPALMKEALDHFIRIHNDHNDSQFRVEFYN